MIKIALFGSYYRGYEILKALLEFKNVSKSIEIVGVATDDPNNSFINGDKRVWQYPHTKSEEEMVKKLAQENSIEVYTDRVNTEQFKKKLKRWNPEICYMATFGQLLTPSIFEYPKLGFFNLHPSSDAKWPSYVGGNPFQAMINDSLENTVITLHEVNEKFDNGKFIDKSEKIKIPKNATVTGMHKLTSPYAAKLVIMHLKSLLNSTSKPKNHK